jgi:hypothetical protein
MPDLTSLCRRTQLTRSWAQALQSHARQACWHAAQVRQEAALNRQRAHIACLRRCMLGATELTCAITVAILMQRGLLNGTPGAGPCARWGVARAAPHRASPRTAAQSGRL